MTKKSGLADSPFFKKPTPPKVEPTLAVAKPKPKPKKRKKANHDTTVSRHHDTMTPSNHDTATPWYHDTTIEHLRKTVKTIGKEAATHRFTVEEKRAIRKIVYTLEGDSIFTSENEIVRIAINHAIEDYKKNGKSSLLARVLKALRT